MADVDRAVGIGGAVVQHEARAPVRLTLLADGGVEVDSGPALQDLRLKLGKTGAHREWGLWQEHRVAIVALGGSGRIVSHG